MIKNMERLRALGDMRFPHPHQKLYLDAQSLTLHISTEKRKIDITPTEAGILIATLEHPRDLTPYPYIFRLMNDLLGTQFTQFDDLHLLQVNTARLRKKITPIVARDVLRGIPTRGYILLPEI